MTENSATNEPPRHSQEDGPRFFFDITDVSDFVRRNSTLVGIPRVTIAIIKSMAESHGSKNVFICMKERGSGKYTCMTTERLLEVADYSSASIRYAFGLTQTPLLDSPPTLEKYQGHPLKLGYHTLLRRYRAFTKDDAYFRRRGSSLAKWNEHQSKARHFGRNGDSNSPDATGMEVTKLARAGDELVLLGALWDRPDLHEVFEQLKNQGLRVSLLLYDLIPIYEPELAIPGMPSSFLEWLERVCGYTDQFLAISQHTANEMEKFLSERGLEAPITVVPLAQELPTNGRASVAAGELLRSCEDSTPKMDAEVLAASASTYVLCVGTLEIRKNNLALAQAWDLLAKDQGLDLPKLVFAGKPGWKNEAFFEALEATGNFGGLVHVVRGPTDAELDHLYSKCDFTAMVSLSEGWGLPIGESLSYGKTAVVAANSAMPEAGGDLVEYCDAKSVQSIADACRTLIENNGRRIELEERIRATRLRTWDDVLRDFVDALDTPKASPAQD